MAVPFETVLERCADLLPIPDPCRGLPGLPRRPLPALPFRFLERFTAEDAEIFFGRNREIRELYDRVTSEDGPRVVLLYGQSGAGKSSFLDAGLLPRLGAAHSSVYLRRDQAKGLLRTLADALAPALPAVSAAQASLAPAEALRLAWLGMETAAGRPLIVVVDQVEEAFTLPSGDAHEVSTFIDTCVMQFQADPALKGRLVLGFRKEWFAEIQKQLDLRGIEYSKVFLEALGADSVVEVVGGLRHTKRLRDRYGLELEPGLAVAMARDLTADRDSPVAPTLQVLLSRMWRDASAASSSTPAFTRALYERITKEGMLLVDFLDQQLATLAKTAAAAGGSRTDVVDSGLALDVLRFHVSRLGTAAERSGQELRDEYERDDDVAWLVGELKRLYLLSEPAGDSNHALSASRLAHDTLAQAVRVRFEDSMRAGQRARRIIEARAGEWADDHTGGALDALDLARAEAGLRGMRELRPDEERLLEASRAARRDATRAAMRRRTGARLAAAAVLVALAIAGWLGLVNMRENQWQDMLKLNARIPTILLVEPVGGLIATIDVLDRSLSLNDDRALPVIQSNLATALEGARERISWRLGDEATSLAFSRDGRLAVGTAGGSVRVFPLDGRAPNPPIQATGSAAQVTGVAFSDDGEFLAAALGRQGISVWKRNGEILSLDQIPSQPDGLAVAVRFFPDGHTLIAAFNTSDDTSLLYVCDLDNAEGRTMAIQTMGPVASMATAKTSKGMLLVATAGGDVRLWDATLGTPLLNPLTHGGTAIDSVDLLITPARDVLVAGGMADGSVTMWNVSNAPATASNFGFSGKSTSSVAFGHGGRVIFAGGIDGFVRAFNPEGDEVMPPFTSGGDVVIADLAVSPEGYVAAAGDDLDGKYVRVIDMVGLEIHAPLPHPPEFSSDGRSGVNAMMFDADRPELIVAGLGRSLVKWTIDAPRGSAWSRSALALVDSGEDEATTAIAGGHAGGIKVLAGRDLTFMDADWKALGTVPLPAPVAANALAMSPDGSIAVAGDSMGTVTIWETASRKVTHTIAAHTAAIDAVAFDAGGRRFATSSADKSVRLWSADGSSMSRIVAEAEVTALAFHPDGSLFAGTDRGLVWKFDTSTGTMVSSIPVSRNEQIRKILVHPSGEIVYVASGDGVRMLDVVTSALLDLTVRGRDRIVRSIALSGDGRLLAGATEEGDVILWRAYWREWLLEACERLKNHQAFREIASRTEPFGQFADAVVPRAAFDACTRRVWSAP